MEVAKVPEKKKEKAAGCISRISSSNQMQVGLAKP
jgi:hypothetical protein